MRFLKWNFTESTFFFLSFFSLSFFFSFLLSLKNELLSKKTFNSLTLNYLLWTFLDFFCLEGKAEMFEKKLI